MKKFFFVLLCIFMLAISVKIVGADLTFGPLLVDFSGNGTYLGATFINLNDAIGGPLDNVPFYYDFTLNLIPPGDHLTSAILTLTHVGNVSGPINPEIWLVSTSNNLFIGQLSPSRWVNGWQTDTWNLSQPVLNLMESTDPWSLAVKIDETTNLVDDLFIDKSTLSGTYDPIPEPNTLILLGTGIAGIVGYGIKRRKKA